MKNVIFILAFLFLPFLYVTAQEGAAYAKAMQKGLAQLQQAKSADDYNATANTFSRIVDAAPGEWLPGYYKTFAQLNSISKLPAGREKDQQLEGVLADIEQQLKQQPGNSELLTLKGFQHILYMSADPASRGPQWSPKIYQLLQQALAADPRNPRALLLMGQMQWGAAQFMKSSTDEACRLISKASELYEAEAKAMEEKSFRPAWGASTAAHMQLQCQSATAE
ncbi:hypothetical protein D770_16510 [Flammeovirgaceae bacterium 311]|nr:hypothetical protein D770_16510 [Flammeovirgaceae bacterium 311]